MKQNVVTLDDYDLLDIITTATSGRNAPAPWPVATPDASPAAQKNFKLHRLCSYAIHKLAEPRGHALPLPSALLPPPL